ILRKINPRFAHAIYWRQQRHREALDFCGVAADGRLDRAWFDKLPAPPGDAGVQHEGRFALAGQIARQLRELGRKEQLDQVVETLHSLGSSIADQGRRWTALAALNWQLGRYDDAVHDAAQAIAAGAQPANVFTALVRQNGPWAAGWYM